MDKFLNFMKLPDGTPLIPEALLDWLIGKGFFYRSRLYQVSRSL